MPPDPSALLAWYDRNRRDLPWRVRAGAAGLPDPYRIWLSEIMLQQTTVAAVKPYYARFLERFPDVAALASAPLDDVLGLWAGLGYYARARNLHACARAVAARGGFPDTVEALLELPGIGPYTARAIAAIAFGRPVVPCDGNVERITSRVFAIDAPLPGSRAALARAAETLNADAASRARASDFAQGLFDLGASVCTPRAPACLLCPWAGACLGRARAESLPVRSKKAARPTRHGAHFRLTDPSGAVWLRRRPAEGLLGGMLELPGTAWRDAPWTEAEALAQAPLHAAWRCAGRVAHVFTHFALEIVLYEAELGSFDRLNIPGFAVGRDEIAQAALPSVMRKCLAVR